MTTEVFCRLCRRPALLVGEGQDRGACAGHLYDVLTHDEINKLVAEADVQRREHIESQRGRGGGCC